jgi:hypothetical protein
LFGEQFIRWSAKFPPWSSSSPLAANTSGVAALFVFFQPLKKGERKVCCYVLCVCTKQQHTKNKLIFLFYFLFENVIYC